MEEKLLRRNLALIQCIAEEADVEFILAFKAFALWRTFPLFREYIRHTTASSLYEARMSLEKFGAKAHTYCPAYEEQTFADVARCSSHLTFNTLSQYRRFVGALRSLGPDAPSVGLRVNPEYSEIATALYNPCAPGSRFGVLAKDMPDTLPDLVEGFHCHNHCESDSYALERSLAHLEEKFGRWLPRLKWLNLGGGHLVTRTGYETNHLVRVLNAFHRRHPHLRIILEPGSAFAWQTGVLKASVADVVENAGMKTAVLNVSFTCHMPDCLEMPYWPEVRGAKHLTAAEARGLETSANVYRLGGNSCLSGDFMEWWCFDEPLSVGDEIIFEDMIHYTTVKTNMFNGVPHPSIAMLRQNGKMEMLRRFTYEDYLNRMD